jgi:hypothetical protein
MKSLQLYQPCPVCRQKLLIDNVMDGKPDLYQISYPGNDEYVSPMCEQCLDKLLARRAEKAKKKEGGNRG